MTMTTMMMMMVVMVLIHVEKVGDELMTVINGFLMMIH